MNGQKVDWNPLDSTIGTMYHQAADQGKNNLAGVDWNPQHSDPGQALQKTGNAINNVAKGDYQAAGKDMADSGGNWGRTAAGAAAIAAPWLAPAALGGLGAYAGLGSTAADLVDMFGTGAGIVGGAAAGSGMTNNEVNRNAPTVKTNQAGAEADAQKQQQQQMAQQQQQQMVQQQQMAQQQQSQQQQQGNFDQQNSMEDSLRNAWQMRRRQQQNPSGF